jgi:glycerol-3-phosphate dehydrogenase subunit B
MQVQKAECSGNEVITVWSEAAARQKPHRAGQYVLATGNFIGGGMVSDADGNVAEAIFNLPLKKPARSTAWFQGDFLSPTGHPIFFSGIKVNENLQPVDENGRVLYLNLSVVGSLLADTDPIRERSLEGIALATGYTAGARLGEVQS